MTSEARRSRGIPPSVGRVTGRARQSLTLRDHPEYDLDAAAIVCCWYRETVCREHFTSVRAYELHAADHRAAPGWKQG